MSSSEEEFDGELEEGEVDEGGAEEDSGGDVGDGDDESEDDDEPLASLAPKNGRESPRKRAVANVAKSYAEDDDDDDESDSADDVPLSSLVPRKENSGKGTKNGKGSSAKNGSAEKKKPSSIASPTKKKTAPTKKKTASAKKKAKTSDSKSASTTSSSTNGKKNYEWASDAVYGTECEKGLLIQRLLCRWWYAYEWPDPNVLPKKTPKNYDSLDGFPGVYICTSGESVGKLKDVRNHDDCPSFLNFLKKPSSELKGLLLKALNEQKKVLIEKEGDSTPTEKELNNLIKWANKVNADKADKEIQKVLKAHKFKQHL